MIVSVSVAKDGSGFSAWGHESDGTKHRLSPTWIRDVLEDQLLEKEVPMKEPGKKVKVKRMLPIVVGKKLVYGESLVTATERAKRALESLALGKQPKVPEVKRVA